MMEQQESDGDLQDLRQELARIVDAGVHFVKATDFLESDGPLILYKKLLPVWQAAATAQEIASTNAAQQHQLVTQAKACIQPGLNFFQQKFSVQFHKNSL